MLTDELLHGPHGPQTTITGWRAQGEMMKEKEKKNNYEKLQKDISEEIGYLVRALRSEIDWLAQYSETKISTCTDHWDLRYLVELRDQLEKTKREWIRQNCFLADVEGRASFLLDGVIEESDCCY